MVSGEIKNQRNNNEKKLSFEDNYELLEYLLSEFPQVSGEDRQLIQDDLESGEPEFGMSWFLA